MRNVLFREKFGNYAVNFRKYLKSLYVIDYIVLLLNILEYNFIYLVLNNQVLHLLSNLHKADIYIGIVNFKLARIF